MRAGAIAVLLLAAMGVASSDRTTSSRAPATAFLYTAAKQYAPLAWMKGGERFASGATVFVQDSLGRHALVAGFAASADPAVSFDGKSVLFAGKRAAQDPWQVWEIALDGGDARRITNCADDCIRPFYLPENRVAYAEKVGGRFVVQAAELAGGKPVPLTYGPANSLPTDVLRDGRVLFESAFAPAGTPELYTVYSDGSGVESYRCDHGKARHSGKQVGSGDIVFASQDGLARFTSALAKSVSISAPAGEYAGEVAQTDQGEWLLPWRARASSPFQLMWWKPGQATLRLVIRESGSNVLQPVLIAERAAPKRHPSGLHDWQVGNLLCLNAYTSKSKFAAGSIHSVRLYTRDGAGGARLLGTAAVETDGSFYVQVPGDQPLQVELLDGAGKTLQREAGWFWMRRGEQRVCVGCHAGPETAPENAAPMILLKSTTPADMTHAVGQASMGGH